MRRPIEKKFNKDIINTIPSKTVRKHLLDNKVQFTPTEQLAVLSMSHLDIDAKKQLYLMYAMDYRPEVNEKALKLLAEITLIEFIINKSKHDYTFELSSEKGSLLSTYSFYELSEIIKDTKQNKNQIYKVNIESDSEGLVAQLWLNCYGEILLFEIEHLIREDELSNIKLEQLPFEHEQRVKLIEALGDKTEYVYLDLSVIGIDTIGADGAVALIMAEKYKENQSITELITEINYMSPLVVE